MKSASGIVGANGPTESTPSAATAGEAIAAAPTAAAGAKDEANEENPGERAESRFQSASSPDSPVRMRWARSIGVTKILPSPI
jgi:hypothetical protein